MVKNLPANAGGGAGLGGGCCPSLGWEDPLEKERANPSRLLAWEIPWTEAPGGLQSVGSQRVRHDLAIKQQIFIQV